MKERLKNLIRKLVLWACKPEFERLKKMEQTTSSSSKRVRFLEEKLSPIIDNYGVAVDVHQYSDSWAVVCIQGEKTDFIKFVKLGRTDIKELQGFLRRFDRDLVDAYPPLRNEIIAFRHLERRPKK